MANQQEAPTGACPAEEVPVPEHQQERPEKFPEGVTEEEKLEMDKMERGNTIQMIKENVLADAREIHRATGVSMKEAVDAAKHRRLTSQQLVQEIVDEHKLEDRVVRQAIMSVCAPAPPIVVADVPTHRAPSEPPVAPVRRAPGCVRGRT